MKTVCFHIPSGLLEKVEKYIQDSIFPSRAEFIRTAVYSQLKDLKDLDKNHAEFLIHETD